MKKMILITIFFVAFSQLILPLKASAIFGIPGTPEIPWIDPLDAARAAERAIKCQQIRDDADHHQAELNQALGGVIPHLNFTKEAIILNLDAKEELLKNQRDLVRQEALLAEFHNVGQGLVINENELKSSLISIQTRASDQFLNETLLAMENQSSEPSLRRLAALFRSVIVKNTAALKEDLESEQAKVFLAQLSQIIGTSQIHIAQQKSENSTSLSKNASAFADLSERQANLTAQINQISAEFNAQEERKSCNF